ncbi:hypothetical protein ACLPJG_26570 [Pseudomonas aeruginosa]|uniref:Uncharacterized protein n=3 Tax=Pseudomonas TaxID=286 RepID=A0A3M4K4C5_9PSED|nr:MULTISPECIES: hypothetical protein [Pseudomonas]MCT8191619.1 hypothetical protein [Pseudomonas monteilii]TXG98993.1 MAG: hypothetical protein E6R08_02950 [Nevskiaceae bacterium]MCF3157299.1 hypothetical protein [Pseudomonas juntendi]MDH0760474.1 hypothetical protein [Pseudomonas juntendi]MDH1917929.1 hypothetical protein [Pseudomonas juntendi]
MTYPSKSAFRARNFKKEETKMSEHTLYLLGFLGLALAYLAAFFCVPAGVRRVMKYIAACLFVVGATFTVYGLQP